MIATDQLSLLFIGCFLLGFLYLLVTSLFGGLGHGAGHSLAHHVHVGHGATTHTAHENASSFSLLSIINPSSVVLFLIGFGFFGYALHVSTSFTIPIILALACASGVIIATLLLITLARIFGGVETTTTVQDVSDRTGLLGKVNITIQENSLGEMLYISPGGMRKSVPARSVDGRRLERDQEVVVVNYQHGIAEVDTWDHFVNQESDVSAINPESDDLATLRALLEDPEKTDSEYVIHTDNSKE